MAPTVLAVLLALATSLSALPPGAPASALAGPSTAFVENRGQNGSEVLFSAIHGPLGAWFTAAGARVVVPDGVGGGQALFFSWEAGEAPRGEGVGAGRVHHYRGADPADWIVGAPAHRRLRYPGVADGVDLVFLERDGRLSYDLELAPGADLAAVSLTCEGHLGLGLDDRGRLLVATPAGPLTHTPPVAWELDAAGAPMAVEARFRLLGDDRFGFEVPGRDASRALVIDPGLVWSGYLGGSNADRALAVTLADDGDVVVVGTTGSANFPTTPGAIAGSISGFNDAFITRFDPSDGSLVFSTFLGGADGVIFRPDTAEDVVTGADGFFTVAGVSASPDFPTTPGAFQQATTGGTDAWIARLHPGGLLVWSSLLGGSGNDEACALAVSDDGTVTVAGLTFSNNLPTTAGAFQPGFSSLAFTDDGFVARFSADGSALSWCTYLGGSLRDEIMGLAVDASGRAVVAGLSGSADLPTTTGAFQEDFAGAGASNTDAFVARLAADGTTLDFCTFVGGVERIEAHDVELAADGDPIVAGFFAGDDFPLTQGAAQQVFAGGVSDGFVARLASDGASLVWATALGGGGADAVHALALTGGDQATVTGVTDSAELVAARLPQLASGPGASPTASALSGGPAPVGPGGPGAPIAGLGPGAAGGGPPFDPTLNGATDAFVARFGAAGDRVLYLSFHGGSAADQGNDVTLTAGGSTWIVGETQSVDLPVLGTPPAASSQGSQDALLARFDVPPTTLVSLATEVGPRLSARGAFEVGTPWTLSVTGRPGGLGALLIGAPSAGVTVGGVTLLPWPPAVALPVSFDADGAFSLGGPRWLPPAGMELALQAITGHGGGLQASDGLVIATP